METKVFKSIFFVLILLISKVGMALNVHYCGGQISEISMAWNAEKCQMKSFLDLRGFELRKSHCCNDETLYIQNNTPQKAFDFTYDIDLLILPNYKQVFFFVEEFYLYQKEFPKSHFLIPKNKIFLINSSLIFYG